MVGIERSVQMRIGDEPTVVAGQAEATHAAQLTRHDVTASVRYVRFALTAAQVEAFAAGPVSLAVDHPAYAHTTRLPPATCEELNRDLLGHPKGHPQSRP